MSARAVIVGTATVLGVGAVLALNPADAKSGGPEGSKVSNSSVGDESLPQTPSRRPAQRVAEPGHDFTSEWTERDGWHGSWDDEFREGEGDRPRPPAGKPPMANQPPAVTVPPQDGYTISDDSDDDWFEYFEHGDHERDRHGDDGDDGEGEN